MTTLWLNIFDSEEGDFSCEAAHQSSGEAIEEVSDWKGGFIWKGYRYSHTVVSILSVSGWTARVADLEDLLPEHEAELRGEAEHNRSVQSLETTGRV